jgi:hypothetical protein
LSHPCGSPLGARLRLFKMARGILYQAAAPHRDTKRSRLSNSFLATGQLPELLSPKDRDSRSTMSPDPTGLLLDLSLRFVAELAAVASLSALAHFIPLGQLFRS